MYKIEPTWMTKEFFVPEMCQYALYNDGAYAYHPLNSEIQSLEDIRGIYDVISYHKGEEREHFFWIKIYMNFVFVFIYFLIPKSFEKLISCY